MELALLMVRSRCQSVAAWGLRTQKGEQIEVMDRESAEDGNPIRDSDRDAEYSLMHISWYSIIIRDAKHEQSWWYW